MTRLKIHREHIASNHLRNEHELIQELSDATGLDEAFRKRAANRGTKIVEAIRNDSEPGLMEVFLAEYGLSTDEGVALMCLAEALLRVPDVSTIDALIEDKIAPSSWGAHLGKSSSSLVNASTWALMLTGKVLKEGEGVATVLKTTIKRLGEPVIRAAVSRAMRELGAQFVLGETIENAVLRGRTRETQGYTFSYDMLGEAALSRSDAETYLAAYTQAISALAKECKSEDIRENPGISIKLSALHPRYDESQHARVLVELTQTTLKLAKQAKAAGMGLNIDAEEADRLELSLDVIEAVLSDPALAGWDGFGVVVQAYGKRAGSVIDWLYALATKLDRKIMLRLVKGAYWDTEIKRAQVEGLRDFPVFIQKSATDISYINCAKKLLGLTDRIYPQYATHNAHTVAAILEMDADASLYEFQRLHGMGEALYDTILKQGPNRCRIYAPVGAHKDLLAYLVRRLLENGANSSFVNQIIDETVPPAQVAADPFETYQPGHQMVALPSDLYRPERPNSKGWDLHNRQDLAVISDARAPFKAHQWKVGPLVATEQAFGKLVNVINPADHTDTVGTIEFASSENVEAALEAALPWQALASTRAEILRKAADLYEENFGELIAVLIREAGKTPLDAVAELREAVDFLRYYAARADELSQPARGTFTCISPWNFPLAIFTGQIAAALAAGNSVLAKPAETTSITAVLAIKLLHKAGVPRTALQLLPGIGAEVGKTLTSHPSINGVCFTGSTATAQMINRAMAANLSPTAPLIAETGGINAMIVDSTALPEQAVQDIVTSAFQSAGQRCSALRVLYIQEDIAEPFLQLLFGAIFELKIGNPWDFSTDLGPVIDANAQSGILDHIAHSRNKGTVLWDQPVPKKSGTFVAPTVIEIQHISDLQREVFGPVLHVIRYGADNLDQVITDINATGYGLTFGIHTRIDDRVADVTSTLDVGNIYVNRNQIGAIVGSQPFGGEGLSGTGPKAGGPDYVDRFTQSNREQIPAQNGTYAADSNIQKAIDEAYIETDCLASTILPGPTGESNINSTFGRGKILCAGPSREAALRQASIARDANCTPICVAPGLSTSEGISGILAAKSLENLNGFDGVVCETDDENLKHYRQALAARDGKIIPLMAEHDLPQRLRIERHICIDTTAAGGNASLLAQS